MDRGPRTGVTGGILLSALGFIDGVGLGMAGIASWIAGLIERLVGRVIDFIYLGGGRLKKLIGDTDIIISTDSQKN